MQVYSATRSFPREETYGLRSQLRSSSSSIGTNIAEGCGRRGDVEFRRFLHFSMGSASELQYQLLLARDLRLLTETDFNSLENSVVAVKKMIASLLRKLRAES
ncbi:MAG: four helix bundle protein [Thermoanaerobaculia bacterium]